MNSFNQRLLSKIRAFHITTVQNIRSLSSAQNNPNKNVLSNNNYSIEEISIPNGPQYGYKLACKYYIHFEIC